MKQKKQKIIILILLMIITPIKQNLINLQEMSLLIIPMAIPILIIIKIMEETKEIRIIYPKKKEKNF